MKRFKLLFAVVMLSGFTLTSCSKDDGPGEDTGTDGNIVGRWNQDRTVFGFNGNEIEEEYVNEEETCGDDYLEFTNGGALIKSVRFKDANNICQVSSTTPVSYTRSNNTLTISGGEFQGTYEILRLTGLELWIRDEQTTGGATTTTTFYFDRTN
ncbi:MAG TPA: lipocalin family protein [Flavobacterium sp.]|jgi:predicted small secreted protein